MLTTQPPIKAVGFDLGGVVVDNAVPHYEAEIERELGVDSKQFYTAFALHQPAYERGELTPEQFWGAVIGELGVDYPIDKALRLWTHDFNRLVPDHVKVLGLVDRLKIGGYKVGLLSNTNAEHVPLIRQRHLVEHFDRVVFSDEIGARKPEAAAYWELLRALEVEPYELVFVDDLQMNVEGARTVGMHGVLYHGYEPLVRSLRDLGIRI